MTNPKNVQLTLESDEVANARNGQVLIQPSDNKLAYKDHTGGEHILTTDTNLVDSVNGKTGVVVINPDDLDDSATTNKFTNAASNTKLGHISVTQAVDLDTIESDTATNNAKTTNATHTGDVTGSGALTIATGAVDIAMLSATGTASSSTYLRGDNTWTDPLSVGIDAYYETADSKAVFVTSGLVSIISWLLDGNMEKVGTSNWAAGGGTTLTKETTSPQEGLQWLKIAKAGTGYGSANQVIVTIGNDYRVRGYAKGDGTINPRIYDGGSALLWTGTTSTTWQSFDFNYTPITTRLDFVSLFPAGGFVGFDTVTVESA